MSEFDPIKSRRLDPEEAAFDSYLDAMARQFPSRGRSVLHKPRIPRGTPGKE